MFAFIKAQETIRCRIGKEFFYIRYNGNNSYSKCPPNDRCFATDHLEASLALIVSQAYNFILTESNDEVFEFPSGRIQISINSFGMQYGIPYLYLLIVDPEERKYGMLSNNSHSNYIVEGGSNNLNSGIITSGSITTLKKPLITKVDSKKNSDESLYSGNISSNSNRKHGQSNGSMFVRIKQGKEKDITFEGNCFKILYYENIQAQVCEEDEDCEQGEYVRALFFLEKDGQDSQFTLFSDQNDEKIFQLPEKDVGISIASFESINGQIYVNLKIRNTDFFELENNPYLDPNPGHGINYYDRLYNY